MNYRLTMTGSRAPRGSSGYATALVLLSAMLGGVADGAPKASPELDKLRAEPLVRALRAELARAAKMSLPNADKPYFISYTVTDSEVLSVAGEFGGIIASEQDRGRGLLAEVRVGSYKLDNTNFGGRFGWLPWRTGTVAGSLPLEDDYQVLRRNIWLTTDSAYKRAAEALAKKRAALADRAGDDESGGDFSKAGVVTHASPPVALSADRARFESLVREMSGLFWKFPDVQEGYVMLRAVVSRRTLVTSEGSLLRDARRGAVALIAARTQAPDGMEVKHYAAITVGDPAQLGTRERLLARTRRVLQELTDLRAAPRAKDYSGPVLFEGVAAAQLLRRLFVPHLSGTPPPRSPRGSRRRGSAFANRLHRPVLPRDFQLVDDPTLTSFAKVGLVGHYGFDAEGVAGQRLALVKRGRLQAFLMSRTPREDFPRSNGHGRRAGRFGAVRGYISSLIVRSHGMSQRKLERRLLSAAKRAGEPQGLIVRQLDNAGLTGMTSEQPGWSRRSPRLRALIAYKLTPNGKRTLVRGVMIAPPPPPSFKQILGSGREPVVHNYFSPRRGVRLGTSVITPPLLLAEVDVSAIKGTRRQQPLLPRPPAPKE